MRVCLIYDHLYPATVGGGERWMHDLALALAGNGHDVTYLTMRHWDGDPPRLNGVRVLGLIPAGRVYTADRRSLGPPARFGLAVWRHLLRHGSRYDVVHTAAFPFFPMLAAGVVRRTAHYRLVADWYEVWTLNYWRQYAGTVAGTAGWLIQRQCARLRHRAFCISGLTDRRLVEEGFRGEHSVLPGLYAGPVDPLPGTEQEPLVVFAGRHVREKRIPLLLGGFEVARREHPTLRLELYGDGPDRPRAEAIAEQLGIAESVAFLGKRPQADLEHAFSRAACVATASEREGYGLIVVEAAACGTPSVVVAGDANASVELVEAGINGAVADAPTPESLGAAIAAVVEARDRLRPSTLRWFVENGARLRLERSLELVSESYARAGP